ncbi:MAG: DNA primase [Armatimonadetes bacterium]|nr:DNA primase [Armatimonadota bacterium]
MASEEFREQVRERSDLLEVISEHVALKQAGRHYKALCPFHSEKTPSFTVNPEAQVWKCWGCGLSGDVFAFVMKIENLTFPETLEKLAARAGIKRAASEGRDRSNDDRDRLLKLNAMAVQVYREAAKENPTAVEYLRERGLTHDLIERFQIGYAPPTWDYLINRLIRRGIDLAEAERAGLVAARQGRSGYYDRFRNRIILPICDALNRVVAFGGRAVDDAVPKYLNSPETPVFSKSRVLYGLNLARKSVTAQDRVVVVEGYFDVIAAHQAGIEQVVATLGTALTPEHLKVLRRYTQNAVLAYDADSAGMAAALRSIHLFEESGVRLKVARITEGEDPDSLIRKQGGAAFERIVEEGVPIVEYRLRAIARKHDLTTESGRTGLVREAIPALRQVVSDTDQERYLDRYIQFLLLLNPERAGERLTRMAEAIRREISQQIQRSSRGAKESAESFQNTRMISSAPSALARAENQLLQSAMESAERCQWLFGQIAPETFVDERKRAIADLLWQVAATGEKLETQSLADRLEPEARQLFIDFLSETGSVPLTEPELLDCIERLRHYWKRHDMKRLQELRQEIEAGRLSRDDPRFQEYWQLRLELQGSHTGR